MIVERNIVISILKLTKEGPVSAENVYQEARIPHVTAAKLLRKMQNEGLIYLNHNTLEADTNSRLKLAVKAAALGMDVGTISDLLCWKEFEEIAAFALKSNGYTVQNNVRFKHAGRRFEIDVVGCRKPLVICVDCKHWQRAMAPSALKKIVEAQVERTSALADSLPNIKVNFECTGWERAKFVPAVLSLVPCAYKFYYQVPIVPVLQLQDFINQLPAHIQTLQSIPKTFNTLR